VESADKALARGVGRTILHGLKTLTHRGQPVTITKAAPDQDIASAEACMSAIGALIGQEAQGLVDGMTCEAYQIECLLRAYNALQYFCALESSEPTGEAAADVEVIVLDAKADTTKAVTVSETTKAVETAPAATTGSNGTEANDNAYEGRIKALEAQLAKVLSSPAPGGPVLARRPEEIGTAGARETLSAKAAGYESLALDYQASDPKTAEGYRALAKAARQSMP